MKLYIKILAYNNQMNNENKIAVLIKKLSLEIDKLSNPILEPYDLTNSQFKILKFLLNSPENSIRQVDVEKYFSMTEKKGLIERKINPNDSRSKILCPTEKTMKMKNLLYKLGDELEKKFTSVLNPDEKKTLMQLLKKLLHK